MMFLKQSTAADIALGPFVDSTDGVTAETALTIAQADVRVKKGGGAWAQKNDATSATHEENGWYEVALNSTDTNTLGPLMVAVSEAGALPVYREFMVVPANVYDSLVAGTDTLDVTATLATRLKTNQALNSFHFLMTDSTTHNPATGKTVTVTRAIDTGAFGAGTIGSVTEVANGIYRVDLPAADLNGAVVTLRATASGCDDLLMTLVLEP